MASRYFGVGIVSVEINIGKYPIIRVPSAYCRFIVRQSELGTWYVTSLDDQRRMGDARVYIFNR